MKITLSIIAAFLISTNLLHAQIGYYFDQELKIVAKEKVNAELKPGAALTISGIRSVVIEGYPIIEIVAKNSQGITANFDAKKIKSFEFREIDNINKVWDKHLLLNGTYSNLLSKGLQYELRNEMSSESIEYLNALMSSDRFYKDDYFEDYLYTLVNKIHSGLLDDGRPGNLYVKIVKDVEPSAFSLPNGCIVFSTGLLSTVQSEGELIAIIAHEIAHFVLDHQVLNYNKEIDRKNRAQFWSAFATTIAASAEIYLAINDKNPSPGFLTASTVILSSIVSDEITTRLGVKYNQSQEMEADYVSKEILKVLSYDETALSVALQRIKNYCIDSGNYMPAGATDTHPGIDNRIGFPINDAELDKFTQPLYLKRVSIINSFNARIELLYYSHIKIAEQLTTRNIDNGVGTESDYVIKAVVKRRLSNSVESNEEVLVLLAKAKTLNVTPYGQIDKEEGITYLRLDRKVEAKKAFQNYLTILKDYKTRNDINEIKNANKALEDEINWTKVMIFKVDGL